MAREFTEAELDALDRIVRDWISEGFTTPPYPDSYYDIFEKLDLNPADFEYDIVRPAPGE